MNLEISNLMKVRPVGADLFHANRQKDMVMLTVAFRKIANAPENYKTMKNF